MKKILLLIPFLSFFGTTLWSSNLQIDQAYLTRAGAIYAQFTLRWDNAWKDQINHDGVWVFLKLEGEYGDQSLPLLPAGASLMAKGSPNHPTPQLQISPDQMGLWIAPATAYEGSLEYTLQVKIDTAGQKRSDYNNKTMKVYGVEMVYIPEGSFTLGDPDPAALEYAAFYQSNAQGGAKGLYQINSEQEIPVGAKDNELYYRSQYAEYEGDQKGPIPAAFPKGYAAFWCMKYEITQGQYTDFLNAIYSDNTTYRANCAGIGYRENRGTIRLEGKHFVADDPDRPLNYVSWEDGLAWADWAGLRPMTELEFTKAARGPQTPMAHEYPWNGDNNALIKRYHNADGKLILADGITEGDRSLANRARTGASYYGVMDLAGSVWEKVITIGNATGRLFTGSHGDGKLGFESSANNKDWPLSNWDGGFGYRGGGYYQSGMSYSAFNPHSPIAYRPYGAWSGGPRKVAYGFRCVRTK